MQVEGSGLHSSVSRLIAWHFHSVLSTPIIPSYCPHDAGKVWQKFRKFPLAG